MASSDASSNVRVSLRDFLNWTELPDLPPQPDRLWNTQTYPAGTMPNGDCPCIEIQVYSDLSFRLFHTLRSPGTRGGSCSLDGRMLFQGMTQGMEVRIDDISYDPDPGCNVGSLEAPSPDLPLIHSVCYAFSQAMAGKPIGSPDNPWEDIESGVNASRLQAKQRSGSTISHDIMGVTKRMFQP